MRPPFNSIHQSNQIQPNAKAPAPPPTSQRNMLPNPSQSNASFNMQAQSQTLIPFQNNYPHGQQPLLNMIPSMFLPGLLNTPTGHTLPSLQQNNFLGMPNMGFTSPNNTISGMNHFPVQGQFFNIGQGVNQVNMSIPPPGQNFTNFPQQVNQSMGNLSNGQFGLPSSYQNMNQHVSNFSQNSFRVPNQVPQVMASQNHAFSANQPFIQQCNQALMNLISQTLNGNALRPPNGSAQQLQGQTSMPINSCLNQPQHVNNSQPPPGFTVSQGNSFQSDSGNVPNSQHKISDHRNFTRNSKGAESKAGFQKNQFHHVKNGKKNFEHPREGKGKGFHNQRPDKFGDANFTNEDRGRKRSLSSTYTEQEIKQWREARRKNYPSVANVQKKLTGKKSDSSGMDNEATLRREQLKEILAKQAELGIEVAEIPSEYLLDSESQQGQPSRPNTGKEKYQKRSNKRGRHNKRDQLTKKPRFETDRSMTQSQPTLLQKLLGPDMRRDKHRLLQAFRLIVKNFFFEDWPDKPLTYPSVFVKENGCDHDVVDEGSSPALNIPIVEKPRNVNDANAYDDEIEYEGEEVQGGANEEGEIIGQNSSFVLSSQLLSSSIVS